MNASEKQPELTSEEAKAVIRAIAEVEREESNEIAEDAPKNSAPPPSAPEKS